MTDTQVARFWSKVDRNGPVPSHRPELGPCHVWTAGKNPAGYGKLGVGSRRNRTLSTVLAHRVAFELTHGREPVDLVLHHCDNPACVNVSHLFEGSHRDNVDDKVKKGRTPAGDGHFARIKPWLMPRGERNGAHTKPHLRPRGERNGCAKLTEQQVKDIRANAALCRVTHAELAARYGVVRQTIQRIVAGTRWAQ